MLQIKYHLGVLSYVYTFRGRVCKTWSITKKYKNVLKEVDQLPVAFCRKDNQASICLKGDVVRDYKTGMTSVVVDIIRMHRVRLSNGKEYNSLKLEVI